MIKAILTIALLGVAACELTCDECSMIGADYSALESSPEAIERQIAVLHSVCQNTPNSHHCEENFPDFWRAIAVRLFDGQHGWFAPKHFCHLRKGICAKKSFLGEFVCRDCIVALNDSYKAMDNRENQEQVVEAFMESDFCATFAGENHMEECVNGLEFILPEAMTLLSGQEHMFISEFCQAEGCV